MDSHTSDICREMDGKVFPMSQWEIGVTAPPFHVWCRTTTAPAFGDEFDNIGERAARGEDGKTYYVPADMTYKEWQRAFVEGDYSGLQEVNPDDTMDLSSTEESKDVHFAGQINKENYKCITDDIISDEVIITDERIRHIKERHPNDYERYYGYLKEIVENPQYIVETNKPYTALILKEFMEGKEQFKTVMRLVTSRDNPNFKNSIITFMKINDREWKRILKNKRILYKEE
ncbi:MAG: PBECR2 nuclease fold domain-containing protein [Clostridium sp.]|nr:PBECR2 nuclease fold domain-containing protein [Clostridium sp.]